MARIPDAELSRLKSEVSLLRLVGAEGIALKTPRCRPDRPLPLPRGQDALVGDHPENQPLPLLWLRSRWLSDRLGDEMQKCVIPKSGGYPA